MNRQTAQRALVKLAWLEWLVTHQIGSGDEQYAPLFVEVPGWFWAYELGFAISEGPSILWTFEHLEKINRAHRAVLAGPRRGTAKPRGESKTRRRAALALKRMSASNGVAPRKQSS